MLLERLTLKNFKRFRDQEIRFSDGIIGIVGNNGTGKSSIVEGILFALYGLSGTGIKGDFIVSSFAEPRERCEVRLDFQVRGREFTVRRSFRKGSTTQHEAWLNREEKLLAQGVSEVDREVTRILGMNATDLKNTIFAGQKDLVSLLESRPGERREWFSRVLGIDYLKEQSVAILKERIDRAEHT
ncbi:MAG: SMC family ATPase, partial [Methanomicrobiales archaeon]|nr:SMC family ATPase [Methanomicrobiales archaeon]